MGEVSLSEAMAAGIEPPSEKWASTLAELVDVFAAHYRRAGRSEDEALSDARIVVALLADHFGGRPVYLPRGTSLHTALRDRVIYHLANGNNTTELAARFDLSERRVQQIVAEQQAIQIHRRQGKLFT